MNEAQVPMQDYVARLESVVVRRGTFTLDVPELRFGSGRVIGVVGPNGSGKTTLLSLLPGLLGPDEGRVRVFDRDPVADPEGVRSRLGYMSDDMPVFDVRLDKLLHIISGYYATWDSALVATLVERFRLDLTRRTSRLSKGEATRIRLIMALAFRPRLVVLDEPATGLDVGGRRKLLETVLEAVRDPEVTVVISSHQLGDVERLADELVIVHDGRIVTHAPTDEVLADHTTLEQALLEWGVAG